MTSRNLVVIGVSTGGPLTLKALFKELPPLDAAFLIVLHITPQMDYRIAQGLGAAASMPVKLAEDGEFLKRGHVYMAPGGLHLQLTGNNRVVLCEGPRVNYVQPAADVTMLSLSRPLKGKLIGIVLTGMGRDGADGIKHIHDIGGITIAQDQQSSTIYGMPKAAAQTGAVDYVLPPKKIAGKLMELLAPI
ncbi:CheB methylesterase domain-containing protein [Geomonas propionica]|uniref:protein-glutamate methylesterase n=1 Tax=Geomonas propionica TaxID=2798582 RepID=A0ABS0YSM1_9BACT|nr:CheB methylesterase domain-containing protein [Geomonas propionica]MBJ6800981.1 chemotaxis protein CheB [Geomonas propionica]